MRLLITKVWAWWDIALLKWCAFLFGVTAGIFFSECLRPYIWGVLAAAVLLTIRPALVYWRD